MSKPGSQCQVCQHPDREAIEQALLNGRAMLTVARDFRVGSRRDQGDDFRPDHKIIRTHIDAHMGEDFRAVKAEDQANSGRAMVERLNHLDAVVDESLARLTKGDVVMHDGLPVLDPDGTGQALRRFAEADIRGTVREARRNLELRTRLAGVNPEGDPDAADDARDLLLSPAARLAINALEDMLRTPVQGN